LKPLKPCSGSAISTLIIQGVDACLRTLLWLYMYHCMWLI